MIQVEIVFFPPSLHSSSSSLSSSFVQPTSLSAFFQLPMTMLVMDMLTHVFQHMKKIVVEHNQYAEDPFSFWALSYEAGHFQPSHLATHSMNLPYSILSSKHFPNMLFFSREIESNAQNTSIFDFYSIRDFKLDLKFYLQCQLPSCENCCSRISVRTPFNLLSLRQNPGQEPGEEGDEDLKQHCLHLTKEEKEKENVPMISFLNFEKEVFTPTYRCFLGHLMCASCYFSLMQSQLHFFCPICDQHLDQLIELNN